MLLKVKRKYVDYRQAQEEFHKACEHGRAYLTFDFSTQTYELEYTAKINKTAELMRNLLFDIYVQNDLPDEQADALAYADSAIKTLVDMGVLK